MWRVLVVEDTPEFAAAFAAQVAGPLAPRATFVYAADLAAARGAIEADPPDLVVLDAVLPKAPGGRPDKLGSLELLAELPRLAPGLPVVMLSGQDRRDAVQLLLSRRVDDYLFKDDGFPEIRARLEAVLDRLGVARARRLLKEGIDRGGPVPVVGSAPAFAAALVKAEQVAPTETTVLLLGESGTGKEVLARHIHHRSRRAEGPFVAVSCGAIPEGLAEAELFGARKGAYTGLDAHREGAFGLARGGTLFLDEVGELPLGLQPKLLRAVQERVFRPLGSAQEERADVRILCATHRDLEEQVRLGAFRQDLFFRIHVFPIVVPPLRERREDLPRLVAHLIDRFRRETGRPIRAASPAAMAKLQAHGWPGNVRELVNAIEYAFVLETGVEIGPESLPPLSAPAGGGSLLDLAGHAEALATFERAFLQRALARNDLHLARTAEAIGIPRRTLQNRMAALGIRVRG